MELQENTRSAQVKRFLAKPPKQAHKMTLVARAIGTTQDLQLGEWPVDEEFAPRIADEEILPVLDETSREMNAGLVASLTYWSASGAKLQERVINRSNVNVRAGDSLASTPEQLTGDYTSQATQAQKHLEVMMRLHLTNLKEMFALQRQAQEHTMELCDRLATRVVESERREERAKAERDELAEVMATVEDSQGGDSEVNASQARLMKLLEPAMPIIVQGILRALSPTAGPTGWGSPTPPPAGE
jgi:hypothetical protein